MIRSLLSQAAKSHLNSKGSISSLANRFAGLSTAATPTSETVKTAPRPIVASVPETVYPAFPPMATSISKEGTGGKGLLDFFDSEKGWYWSENDPKTGRGWTCAELRTKSFEDLHKLWWICIKEQNKLLSQKDEARMFRVIFPNSVRLQQVRVTMRGIRMVVQERRVAYLQAQAIVERETTRQQLFTTYFNEYKASYVPPAKTEAATEPSETAENEAGEAAAVTSQKGRKLPKDWIPAPPDLKERVEAEMSKMFPIPVHMIGRKAEERRRVDKALERTESAGRKKHGEKKQKREKMKGSRWFVV
ncbi:39S ribosomal protein L47, mitochondrial [Chytriomyces hyalinus]|nr:39S ribosomal protein L47, mitochondrial [Chytriomyces hyalinus]KAJ3262158.1 39S ribosomal protein L47, mitochondrial [Chytriomyces hyalinus]